MKNYKNFNDSEELKSQGIKKHLSDYIITSLSDDKNFVSTSYVDPSDSNIIVKFNSDINLKINQEIKIEFQGSVLDIFMDSDSSEEVLSEVLHDKIKVWNPEVLQIFLRIAEEDSKNKTMDDIDSDQDEIDEIADRLRSREVRRILSGERRRDGSTGIPKSAHRDRIMDKAIAYALAHGAMAGGIIIMLGGAPIAAAAFGFGITASMIGTAWVSLRYHVP